MTIFIIVALVWALFGAWLLLFGHVVVAPVDGGPLPQWLAGGLAYTIGLIIGPPLWVYAVTVDWIKDA